MRATCLIVSAVLSVPLMLGEATAQVKQPDGLYYSQLYSGGSLTMGALYFKAGQVIRDPSGSIDFNAASKDRGRVGRYTVSRNGMAVAWDNGERDESVIEPDPDGVCFNWNTNTICPAPVFKPGERLLGIFERNNSLLKPPPEGVDAAGSTTVTFGPNNAYSVIGTWALRFTSTTPGNEGGPDVSGTGTGKPDVGTFGIEPNWITFNSADGKRSREIAFPITVYEGKRGTPDHLYFGGPWYVRRQ